jgi:periplasmic protein CpxP/Spy
MSTWTQRLLIATTAAAFLGVAPAMAHGGKEGSERGQRMEQRMTERMAERQNALKQALNLTPAQQDAWNRYTQALDRPQMAQHGQHREAMGRMNTPERLDHMKARMAERDARFQRMAEATRAFYASLTPEQQQIFDQQSPMGAMSHRGGDKGQGGHRHGGMHGRS